MRLKMVERYSRVLIEPEIECRVVHEVSTNTGSVQHDWDVVVQKLRSWADTRKHQDLRRVYGAAAKAT